MILLSGNAADGCSAFNAHKVRLVAAFDGHDHAAALRVALVCVCQQAGDLAHIAILSDDERLSGKRDSWSVSIAAGYFKVVTFRYAEPECASAPSYAETA